MLYDKATTNKHRSLPLSLLLSSFFLVGQINAAPEPSTAGDMPELMAANEQEDQLLLELLEVLEEETEIATKTKMNIDFVPGMASVLHGKDLLNRGALTLNDALALIPGVEVSMTNVGQQQIIFRGTSKTFLSSNAKLLLNGIPMNSTLNAQSPIFSIPMEQVDRIEVIRGPGSSIYGEFAFAGVINVITHSEDRQFFTRTDGFGGTTIGGAADWLSKNQPLRISVNFSDVRSDGTEVQAGPDKLYGRNASNSPGTTNERQENQSLVLLAKHGPFSLNLHHVRNGVGDHFGLNDILPPPESYLARTVTDQAAELIYDMPIFSNIRSHSSLGWSRFTLESNRLTILPAGFQLRNPNTGAPIPHPVTGDPIVFPDGAIGKPYHSEQKLYGGLELEYTGFRRHDLLFGINLAFLEQTETWVERNYSLSPTNSPFLPTELTRFTGDENWLQDGLKRRSIGAFVQDQYAVTDKLTVTAGLRFDDYDDVGNAISPRVAAVYRIADAHTLKVQYAKAFRPPTFIEMFTQNNPVVSGNPDISPEKLTSHEIGYIFNNGRTITRLILFHLSLDDMIISDLSQQPGIYRNATGQSYMGSEAELIATFNRFTKFNANVTYLDRGTAPEAAGLANLLANTGIVLQPSPHMSLALQHRYVGERTRESGDPRPPLQAYNVLDVTFTLQDMNSTGMTIRAGVSNALDEPVVYPAPVGTYSNDYPRPGRVGWIQVAYEL